MKVVGATLTGSDARDELLQQLQPELPANDVLGKCELFRRLDLASSVSDRLLETELCVGIECID